MLVTNIYTKAGVLLSRPRSSPQFCNTQMQDMHKQPTWHPEKKSIDQVGKNEKLRTRKHI